MILSFGPFRETVKSENLRIFSPGTEWNETVFTENKGELLRRRCSQISDQYL